MALKNYSTPPPSLREVKEQFRNWRKTRKSHRPIPENLWQAAVGLTAKHSISKISKELVVDYSALKKRVPIKKKNTAASMSPAGFIELNLESPAAVTEYTLTLHKISVI
jgi:hypothetical protein